MRWVRIYHAILPVVASDPTSVTGLLSNQLPFAILVVIIGIAGYKKAWRFGHQYDEMKSGKEEDIDRLLMEKIAIKKESDEQVERVRKDTEVEIARLKEERERERTRAERYEAMVMRSVDQSRETVDMVKQLAELIKQRSI
jgi:uncharacterized transporter YbjL